MKRVAVYLVGGRGLLTSTLLLGDNTLLQPRGETMNAAIIVT